MPSEADLDLFSARHEIAGDATEFRTRVMREEPHSRVDPCFMTGKGCVYSDSITREMANRHARDCCCGFLVTPFRNNLKVFIRNSLLPYFEFHYRSNSTPAQPEESRHIPHGTMELNTAEEVRRPGIIICEGICKRLQQSDFVVADISLPNANVFYELGLAYGVNHKVILIYQDTDDKCFGKATADYFGAPSFAYPNLLPIKLTDFVLSKKIWQRSERERVVGERNRVAFYEQSASSRGFAEPKQADEEGRSRDISLAFGDHVRSNVGTAIGRIYDEISGGAATRKVIEDYYRIVKDLHKPDYIDPKKDFSQVISQVDASYCLIVRTGNDCHPMSYFWLGYAHARGMNVIPITVQDAEGAIPEDLAFDIRAQRHMVFIRERPERLERELTAGLRDMIYGDFAEWSRKRFWERMLGRPGVVSILTAALHSEDHDREMIGDWDLRAASELASFFNQHQIRASIETPIYQPEYSFVSAGGRQKRIELKAYVSQLEPLLEDKNCIVIASPDVNPLTEFILGHIYNVPPDELFSAASDVANKPHAIVAVKEVSPTAKRDPKRTPKRVFYREVPPEEAKEQGQAAPERLFRGFRSNAFEDTQSVMAPFHSQSEPDYQQFDTFGHLVILPNPFGRPGHYIILLNGVSGPATFALTHVLTGNAESEFSAYDPKAFDPAVKSEGILNQILATVPETGRFKAIQCIIKVGVGANPKQPATGTLPYDWRRILSWSLYGEEKEERGLKPPIQVIQSDALGRR
ncbi:MAG: hypothetical protein H7A45_03865 [Verrucomicrobiales bacterium]|nr:hypothetical protein [Verrucomicrobiales bacterium]